jgi:hypothetical protein
MKTLFWDSVDENGNPYKWGTLRSASWSAVNLTFITTLQKTHPHTPMKTPTQVLLLVVMLHASQIHAAEGDLKPALDALQQRHAEALTAATPDTTGSVEDAWYLDLKKLRLDALAKNDTVTAKKIEAMLLAAGRNGVSLSPPAAVSAPSVPMEKKLGVPEKGSQWDGPVITYSSTDRKKEYGSAESKITAAEGNTFVLRTSLDEGQIWDWTFKQEGSEIEVIKFDRIRAASTINNPRPPVGITGKGRIENDRMTFSFSWPQKGKVWMGDFELKLVK